VAIDAKTSLVLSFSNKEENICLKAPIMEKLSTKCSVTMDSYS